MDTTDHNHDATMGEDLVIENNNAYLMAMGEGSRIEIHAADSEKTGWTNLETRANSGDSQITVQNADMWQVGDQIAISSTDGDWTQAEERTITGISEDGKTIFFDEPLEHAHRAEVRTESNGQTGEDARQFEYDVRAEVANLSRNVTIQGDEDSVEDGMGGHTMVHGGAEQHIDGVEYFRMGQEDVLGRYPIHWHELGDAGEGQYVDNVAVHHSYQKGITIHSTNKVTVEDSVIFDHVGHGVFLEDGDETNNHILGNLVFNTRSSDTGQPIITDGDHVSSFWIENPENVFFNNVAAGGESNGFWIMTTEGDLANLNFVGNVGHSYSGDGGAGGTDKIIGVDGQVRSDTDFGQKTLDGNFGVIEDFTAYEGNAWFLTHELVIKDSVFADTRFFTRHENVIEDTLIDDGTAVIYRDGGAQYNNVHFADGVRVLIQGSDHANTQDAFNNVTYEGRDAAQFFYNADEGDQHVFVDLDGSLTGRDDGTYFVVQDTALGNFKAAPDAELIGGLGWATKATVGATEITAAGASQVSVVRSDGAKDSSIGTNDDRRVAGDNNGDRSDSNFEFNTATGMERDNAWLLDFNNTPGELTLNLTGVRLGDSAVYEIPGIAGSYQVTTGEARSNSFDELLNSDKTTYYRDDESGSVFVRIVADKLEVQDERPVEDLLAEFRAHDNITIKITGQDDPVPFNGHDQVNDRLLDAIADQPARVIDTQAEIQDAQADLTLADFELERYESTSDTTEVSDGLARWSEASSWDKGVPGEDDIVVINEGETVVLDTSTTVKGIIVNGGELIVEDDGDLDIDVATDYLLVLNGGLFQAGTEDDLLDTDFTLTLEGDDPDFDLHVSAILRGEVPNTVLATTTDSPVIPVDPMPEMPGADPVEEVVDTPDEPSVSEPMDVVREAPEAEPVEEPIAAEADDEDDGSSFFLIAFFERIFDAISSMFGGSDDDDDVPAAAENEVSETAALVNNEVSLTALIPTTYVASDELPEWQAEEDDLLELL